MTVEARFANHFLYIFVGTKWSYVRREHNFQAFYVRRRLILLPGSSKFIVWNQRHLNKSSIKTSTTSTLMVFPVVKHSVVDIYLSPHAKFDFYITYFTFVILWISVLDNYPKGFVSYFPIVLQCSDMQNQLSSYLRCAVVSCEMSSSKVWIDKVFKSLIGKEPVKKTLNCVVSIESRNGNLQVKQIAKSGSRIYGTDTWMINSLAPWRCGCNLKLVISNPY